MVSVTTSGLIILGAAEKSRGASQEAILVHGLRIRMLTGAALISRVMDYK